MLIEILGSITIFDTNNQLSLFVWDDNVDVVAGYFC